MWSSLTVTNDVDHQFAVVYHLHNWYENKRIKSKCLSTGETWEIKQYQHFLWSLTGWREKRLILWYKLYYHPQLKRSI
jgi:NADH-quinone oxidoreductase subunit C